MITAVVLATMLLPRARISAWLGTWDGGGSMKSFAAHASMLDTVTIEGLMCTPTGESILGPTPTPEDLTKAKEIAHKNYLTMFMIASNSVGNGPDGNCVHDMLHSKERRLQHVNAMLKFITAAGMDGVDLDYEGLKGEDRDVYSEFVELLAHQLHAHKKLLAIAVHPKSSEPGNWDGAIAQDWPRLGKVVDRFRVMCYDQHWETSDAGPIASPKWVEEIMNFAISVVPRQKLELGIPSYGYDWKDKKATSFGWKDLAVLRSKCTFTRDVDSQELTGKYDGRTVFFADAVAAKPKYEIANRLGVHGLALWRIGSEDPAIWSSFSPKR